MEFHALERLIQCKDLNEKRNLINAFLTQLFYYTTIFRLLIETRAISKAIAGTRANAH